MSIERRMSVFELIDYVRENLSFISKQLEEVREENARIKSVLSNFYTAPLSMSSVQPILDLAVELAPELKDKQ